MGSITAGAWYTLLKFGENCFIHAEIINIFQNPRWRPPPSWIFKIFIVFINHRVHTILLRTAVNFGQDWSAQSKVASIFRNFCFGLNFPFEGLFWAVFGGGRPPKVISYNSNPQKALPSTERRHLTSRSWKSADSCRRAAMTRKHKQKRDTHFPWYFTPFPGVGLNQNAPIDENLQGAWSPWLNHVCQTAF